MSKKGIVKNTAAVVIAAVMMFLGAAAVNGFDVTAAYGANEGVSDYPNYVDRQLVVVFNDDIDRTAATDIVAFALAEELVNEQNVSQSSIRSIRDGLSLAKVKTNNNMMLVSLGMAVDEEAAAKEIAKNPDVVSAQPNYLYTFSTGSDTDAAYESGDWYLDYINAKQARSLIKKQEAADGNAGKVAVASLDTCVMKDHEAFKGANVISTSKDERVSDSHGTEMAGLIAKTAGKDRVKILAIDIFNENSSYAHKSVATTTGIVAGIDYACRHDARIVTMAFGRHGKDKALAAKINWAAKGDVLVIAAAGDTGNVDSWYPSDCENCLSCINTVKYDNAFSNACRNESSGYGKAKTICAPGTQVSVPGLDGGFTNKTGTSYSAAIVAAAAAMVMYADPDITAAKTREILLDTASDLGAPGRDIYTADGNVNAYKAVAKAYKVKADDPAGKRPGRVNAKAKASEGGITISWNAISGADAYLIYRKGLSDDHYVRMIQISGEETSWTDKTCEAGKIYSYKVAAGKTSRDGKKLIGKYSKAASAMALEKKN